MAVLTFGKRHITRPVHASTPATILVVDDDADMMRIAMHTLAAAGYRCRPARRALDALHQVRLARPDVIVTNLAMPDMSGVEFIGRIKRDPETAAIPVLAVTHPRWNELAQSAAAAGCDGYVGKPFQGSQLLVQVERALARSRDVAAGAGHTSGPPDLCA